MWWYCWLCLFTSGCSDWGGTGRRETILWWQSGAGSLYPQDRQAEDRPDGVSPHGQSSRGWRGHWTVCQERGQVWISLVLFLPLKPKPARTIWFIIFIPNTVRFILSVLLGSQPSSCFILLWARKHRAHPAHHNSTLWLQETQNYSSRMGGTDHLQWALWIFSSRRWWGSTGDTVFWGLCTWKS